MINLLIPDGQFPALIKVVHCRATKEELPETLARRQTKRLRVGGS